MKKIKVNYKKCWGNDGTCYNQIITLKKDFIKYINKQIRNYWNSSEENKRIIEDSIGFNSYYNFYLEELELSDYIFLNITKLQFIYYYLSINNYDIKRVKCRNTIVKVVD